MRAVMTVTGKDIIGILAEVSGKCSELNVNITEVTQSVLQDLFCMIMLVDTEKCSVPLSEFSDIMSRLGREHGIPTPCNDLMLQLVLAKQSIYLGR